MVTDLQRAGMWKRISAWLFDAIMLSIFSVLFAMILSAVTGYDSYNDQLDAAYAKYENQYGVVFNIDEQTYEALTQEEKDNYDAAYAALVGDSEAVYTYNMVINLTLLITSVGILLAVAALEIGVPLWLKNGQTLGKKIFGIAVMRTDSIRLTSVQLFIRTILGKYAVEIMIPVFIAVMLLLGIIGSVGTIIVLVILGGQIICMAVTYNRSAIHDLLAGTVVVDISSQQIFQDSEELIEYTKKIHAERAAQQSY